MGGFFGVVSEDSCVSDLFFGTDYHSHLGTMRGGLVTRDGDNYTRFIHDITNSQFRSKFEDDLDKMSGNSGIGVISDYEDQPLVIGSKLGVYAIVTVGVVQNLDLLAEEAFSKHAHFSEMNGTEINPTEIVAMLINEGKTFSEGLEIAQGKIEGSCSILLLTEEGIYASRDKFGRTPIILGEKEGSYALTFESCAFPTLSYRTRRELGPGEIIRLTNGGDEQLKEPNKEMKICSFLWVYYGYPSSTYEGINTEDVRYRCGACLAKRDNLDVDSIAGIPDSGTAHAIGYANESDANYSRPFVKYTPTWPRSFMPQNQAARDMIANMKLIPVRELIEDKRLLFCDDSIVRGTQLTDIIKQLYDLYRAKEIHMRVACPPLVHGCKYLNFSRSRSELELATRRAIKELEGDDSKNLAKYADSSTPEYKAMLEKIRERLNLTTLKYQKLEDLVDNIGLPKEKLCTYCFDGQG